ncbi:(d)CMP kinase [Fontivita pretiosa]|uniref:(d)CMP kinase n=1 Tax=Fontivita pretiosa TaxID=2989684 RepID=UPI003D18648F
MIITIDGPAGTGKSSVALAVAQRLGFDFLDTGAMYRAIGLEAIRRQANLEDPRELTYIARHARIEFDWSRQPPAVKLNGENVGHLLRGSEATRAASYVAAVPAIRQMLVEQQRQIGRQRKNLVTEGRDQGSVVFPDAQFKFYLDATPHERARRRAAQLRARGEVVDYNEILSQIIARDHRDASRAVGPLAVPPDARIIDTTHMTQDQVVDLIVATVQPALGGADAASAGSGA